MSDINLNSKTPTGDLHTAWTRHKDFLEKLSKEEANKYKIIIIGTGLAGASAAATLDEKGFKEIVLSGINLGDFGNENNENCYQLLKEIEDSTNVQFYAVAQDSRLANEFGGGFIVTGYGAAEPIEIFVDDIIGFGNPFVDFFAMIFMMGILYGVVWGGLYKAVGIATESEKRKSETEGLNKVPKKKAKPPKKPGKRSVAAITKGE